MFKLVCFPGWSAQRQLSNWQGRPALTIPHTEQWAFLSSNAPVPEEWLPTAPWVMVTWSMGTFTGLKLSQLWGDRAPKAWLALSPFVRLVGSSYNKIKVEELQLLIQSFRAQPEKTLEFFCRQQGGKISWSAGPQPEHFTDTLTQSLEALLKPAPFLPQKQLLIPTYTILGERDRLVNTAMVDDFCQHLRQVRRVVLEQKSHGLFYENFPLWPEELTE